MIIRPCTFDGCTVLTIGSRCVEHDVPVTRSFVRGRPLLERHLDAIGACPRHAAVHRHHLARPVSAHRRRVRTPVAPPTASARRVRLHFHRAPLPPDHVRLSDEQPRLRAHQGHARVARHGGGRLEGGRRSRRLQHVHDPREAGHQALRLSRRCRCPQAGESRPRDRRRRLLRRGAAGEDLRPLPAGRRGVRAGLDPAPRGVGRHGRRGRRPRPVRHPRALRRPPAAAPRARPRTRGCRCRWAATRRAPTASCRRFEGASRAAAPATSWPR